MNAERSLHLTHRQSPDQARTSDATGRLERQRWWLPGLARAIVQRYAAGAFREAGRLAARPVAVILPRRMPVGTPADSPGRKDADGWGDAEIADGAGPVADPAPLINGRCNPRLSASTNSLRRRSSSSSTTGESS